ncbi:MAG: hypothetical protein ABFC34_14380 [Methanobacterium sp.]
MNIFDIGFLIIGIFLIIVTTLDIFNKQKYPEKELNYIFYLFIYFIGILWIIVATGFWPAMLFILVLFYLHHVYLSKKHPERYKSPAFWEKLAAGWTVLVILIILVLTL